MMIHVICEKLYFHIVFCSVFSHAGLREQVSTLTWQLLWTTTIFNSKIARKSSQKRSPKLITFWLLSWTLLFVDLASQTLPFWASKIHEMVTTTHLERIRPCQGAPRRSYDARRACQRGSWIDFGPLGIDFGLDFGSISTRFKTSPYAPS